MHKHFELVVFTASLSKYADPLVDILDPEKMCAYKLFRLTCTCVEYLRDTFQTQNLYTAIEMFT